MKKQRLILFSGLASLTLAFAFFLSIPEQSKATEGEYQYKSIMCPGSHHGDPWRCNKCDPGIKNCNLNTCAECEPAIQ